MRDKQNKGAMKDVIETIVYILLGAVVSLLLITYVGQLTIVDGKSMENTLSNGERIILDKITYCFDEPKRFDIIIFPVEGDHNRKYIKRIIGLPGETVQIIEGQIYIDEKLLEEDYGKETMEDSGEASEPISLSMDEYFVLGDNRNDSSDSRTIKVGTITRSDIRGRAWLRVWPFSKFGVVNHQ